MHDLSPEAQAIRSGIDRDSDPDMIMADALNAAADQLPTVPPLLSPALSQIYYSGSAKAANLLRQWAKEIANSEALS